MTREDCAVEIVVYSDLAHTYTAADLPIPNAISEAFKNAVYLWDHLYSSRLENRNERPSNRPAVRVPGARRAWSVANAGRR